MAPVSSPADERPTWAQGEPEVAVGPRAGALAPVTAMLLGGALSCLLVGGGFLLGARNNGGGLGDPVQQVGGNGGTYGNVNEDSGNAIVEAVKKVGPAVMNVDTTFGRGGTREFLPDPGDFGPRQGKGTGVVIDSARGLMLTNAHVVQGAAKIQATARDGKKYTGVLIGTDAQNDIALVELSNKKLPAAKLAAFTDPKQLRIGEWAIAIGNPFAQANTVTVGVVSAVGRQIGPAPMPGKPNETITLYDMIQTDAAINPGNSGGPLCNIRGEVIGINTAILPVGQGLGFTIPINKAKAVADTLLRNGGKVPYIGILMTPIDAKIKREFSLKEDKGIFVQRVVAGSPAAQSGMQNGDVIVKVDGRAMIESEQVMKAVRSRKIGDTVQVEVSRSGARRQLTMKIAAKPE
jgi:serine protease Do